MVRDQRKMVALYVYLYTNEHVLIPRLTKGIYGSAFKRLLIAENTTYRHKFYVNSNKVIDIDKGRAGQRCVNDGAQDSVGRCIVRYIEEDNNCTTYGLMANKAKQICNKTANKHVQIDWLEEEIFELTGCLPNCARDMISFKQAPDWPRNRPASSSGQTVQVLLQYEDGSYYLTEEYEDYDLSSFIADVGGYLGLLLGHSVLSYYYIFVDLMMKVKDVKIKR